MYQTFPKLKNRKDGREYQGIPGFLAKDLRLNIFNAGHILPSERAEASVIISTVGEGKLEDGSGQMRGAGR